ncbi:unnamed protein product [Trichogramma brassicae]|uniref:Uncharacterized protein n=1 Tax=Trichogramma brassicae TaxID=86971 RepID=A0A6H5HYP8_9HYME|nr:unnamed protein product [Trichogramma brassicae]
MLRSSSAESAYPIRTILHSQSPKQQQQHHQHINSRCSRHQHQQQQQLSYAAAQSHAFPSRSTARWWSNNHAYYSGHTLRLLVFGAHPELRRGCQPLFVTLANTEFFIVRVSKITSNGDCLARTNFFCARLTSCDLRIVTILKTRLWRPPTGSMRSELSWRGVFTWTVSHRGDDPWLETWRQSADGSTLVARARSCRRVLFVVNTVIAAPILLLLLLRILLSCRFQLRVVASTDMTPLLRFDRRRVEVERRPPGHSCPAAGGATETATLLSGRCWAASARGQARDSVFNATIHRARRALDIYIVLSIETRIGASAAYDAASCFLLPRTTTSREERERALNEYDMKFKSTSAAQQCSSMMRTTTTTTTICERKFDFFTDRLIA